MARPRSDIDERVLRAAAHRFLRDGVDGASLREIARDAGTSVGMVSYYFPNKDALFAAVVERSYVTILRDIAAALEPGDAFEAQITRLHARVVAVTDEEFLVLRLVLRELLLSSPRAPALVARFSVGHIPLLLASLARASERGEIRDDVPRAAVALALAGGTLGALLAGRILRESPLLQGMAISPESLASGVREVILRGLAPRR